MKLICLEACHGVEVHGCRDSRLCWISGRSGLYLLFRDGRHIYEAWPPQSVMCRLCWVFPDGWWGGGCVCPPVRCLFLCCADAGRSSCDLLCAGLLGSVPRCRGAGFFCNYGSGFWGNLTPSACAVDGDPLASFFLPLTAFSCRRRRVARRRGKGGGVQRYGLHCFSRVGFCCPRECSSGAKKVFDYGSLAEAVWYVLFLVLRRPRNDPLGAWSVGGVSLGGLASSLELSVGGEGACWTGLVASVGGGMVAVCVSLSEGTLRCPRN